MHRNLEGTIFGWHRHICPNPECGNEWQHDGGLAQSMTYEAFESAHHCADCGAESRYCEMPIWTTAVRLAQGLGTWCRRAIGRPDAAADAADAQN